MSSPSEPDDEVLVAFAAFLLAKLPPRLREREVLEDAVRQHRDTWLALYAAGSTLKTATPAG